MRPGEVPYARVKPAKPARLAPETHLWFWNPNLCGVKTAPEWFKAQLEKVGNELAVTWNPLTERWQVFMRAPQIQHPICRGWKLLFVHQDADGGYLPLDERLFARLYAASVMEHGSAKAYFDRIVSEMERDKAKREKDTTQESIDRAMPYFDHSQIKVAMRGPSNGSKFSTYHA